MTFNFWPFNCATTRRQEERDRAHENRREDILQSLDKSAEPLIPALCHECGGLFVPDSLNPVTIIQVFSPPQPVVVTEKFFCKKCLPVTNIEVNLVAGTGSRDNLDTAYFSTQEGYLQPFDFQGEEQAFISVDDYPKLYCGDCGVVTGSKTTKCQDCRRK